MGRLFAPNGATIVGTLESIPGVSGISSVTMNELGEYELEHDDETTVDWDQQETVVDVMYNCRVFMDENNESWLENELTFKETEDD